MKIKKQRMKRENEWWRWWLEEHERAGKRRSKNERRCVTRESPSETSRHRRPVATHIRFWPHNFPFSRPTRLSFHSLVFLSLSLSRLFLSFLTSNNIHTHKQLYSFSYARFFFKQYRRRNMAVTGRLVHLQPVNTRHGHLARDACAHLRHRSVRMFPSADFLDVIFDTLVKTSPSMYPCAYIYISVDSFLIRQHVAPAPLDTNCGHFRKWKWIKNKIYACIS